MISVKRFWVISLAAWSVAALADDAVPPVEESADEAAEAPVTMERYQSVIDRSMFGPMPANFDRTKPLSEIKDSRKEEQQLSAEEAKLKSSVQFCMINVTPSGEVAVGFTDNEAKPPQPYYLKVGETRNGWQVIEADPTNATMTVAKGEIRVSLSLGGNSAKDDKATVRTPRAIGNPPRRPDTLSTLKSRLETNRERREKEREERRKQAAAEEQAWQEKMALQLENERQAKENERLQSQIEHQKELTAMNERATSAELQLNDTKQQLEQLSEQLSKLREEKALNASENADSGGPEAKGDGK